MTPPPARRRRITFGKVLGVVVFSFHLKDMGDYGGSYYEVAYVVCLNRVFVFKPFFDTFQTLISIRID